MYKDIDHILKNKKRSQRLIKDLLSVIKKFSGLMVSYEDYQPISLYGSYELIDNLGNVQGSWDIKIIIPKDYPFGFPKLFETSRKIESSPETHMDVFGEACVELDILTEVVARKGITMIEFLDIYVSKYFSWQLLNSSIYQSELESWAHEIGGTKQFFSEILNSNDESFILSCIEIIKTRNFPSRNQSCFCGSNKKYKYCHEQGIIKLESHKLDILEKHFQSIQKNQNKLK